MNRDEKTAVVEDIAAELGDVEAIFAVDYRGISVQQAAELRTRLRDADASFRIVKNRLTKLAADKAGHDGLKDHLTGPTALTFVRGDVALAAKALNDLAKQLDTLEFKGGLMNGEALDAEQIRSLAKLPSRETLNAQLVGLVASPITGLARGLNALISGLAIQLRQIEEQGLVTGEAPSAQEGGGEDPAAEGSRPSEAESSDEHSDGSDLGSEDPAAEDDHPAEPDARAEDSAGTESEDTEE